MTKVTKVAMKTSIVIIMKYDRSVYLSNLLFYLFLSSSFLSFSEEDIRSEIGTKFMIISYNL